MIVAIHTYIETFHGFHELDDYSIKKVNDVFEADDLAIDICNTLIKNYIDDEYDINDCDIDYEIYELKLDKLPIGKGLCDLVQNFSLDKDNFLKMYDAKRLF